MGRPHGHTPHHHDCSTHINEVNTYKPKVVTSENDYLSQKTKFTNSLDGAKEDIKACADIVLVAEYDCPNGICQLHGRNPNWDTIMASPLAYCYSTDGFDVRMDGYLENLPELKAGLKDKLGALNKDAYNLEIAKGKAEADACTTQVGELQALIQRSNNFAKEHQTHQYDRDTTCTIEDVRVEYLRQAIEAGRVFQYQVASSFHGTGSCIHAPYHDITSADVLTEPGSNLSWEDMKDSVNDIAFGDYSDAIQQWGHIGYSRGTDHLVIFNNLWKIVKFLAERTNDEFFIKTVNKRENILVIIERTMAAMCSGDFVEALTNVLVQIWFCNRSYMGDCDKCTDSSLKF